MKSKIDIKKGFFSDYYQLYTDGQSRGSLKNSILSSSSEGELDSHKYLFKTRGFLKQTTYILEPETGRELGNISYNAWMTRGNIMWKEQSFSWKFNNAWNTKWTLTDVKGKTIRYAFGTTKGHAESEMEDPGLFLAGLFIQNYNSQIIATVFIGAMVPIWIAIGMN